MGNTVTLQYNNRACLNQYSPLAKTLPDKVWIAIGHFTPTTTPRYKHSFNTPTNNRHSNQCAPLWFQFISAPQSSQLSAILLTPCSFETARYRLHRQRARGLRLLRICAYTPGTSVWWRRSARMRMGGGAATSFTHNETISGIRGRVAVFQTASGWCVCVFVRYAHGNIDTDATLACLRANPSRPRNHLIPLTPRWTPSLSTQPPVLLYETLCVCALRACVPRMHI